MDAFGGVSVPWHLTTRELVADVRRVLRPDGVYLVNVIDYGPQALFAKAEVKTLQAEFPHVAVIARTDELDRADRRQLRPGRVGPADRRRRRSQRGAGTGPARCGDHVDGFRRRRAGAHRRLRPGRSTAHAVPELRHGPREL